MWNILFLNINVLIESSCRRDVLSTVLTDCFYVIHAVTQGIYSRTNKFDGNFYPILTVDDVATQNKPPGFWLNVQVNE